MYKIIYKGREKECDGLKEYMASFGPSLDGIIHSYNGNSSQAIMSMNALFDAVRKGRKYLPDDNSRNIGYGVSLSELDEAAKIGTSLMSADSLGSKKGIDVAYRIMRALVKKKHRITVKNAKGLLRIIQAAEERK